MDLGGSASDGLKRLLEGQDEPDRAAGPQRHEREKGLVFRVLLPTERPAGVGGEDPDLRERQIEQRGDDPLDPGARAERWRLSISPFSTR